MRAILFEQPGDAPTEDEFDREVQTGLIFLSYQERLAKMRRVSLLLVAALMLSVFLSACGGAPASGTNVIDFNSVGAAGAVQAYRLSVPAGYRALETGAGHSVVTSEDGSVSLQVAEVNPAPAATAMLTEAGTYTVNGREVKAYTYSAAPNGVYFHVPVDGNVYGVATTTTDTSAAALERLANIAGTLEVVNE